MASGGHLPLLALVLSLLLQLMAGVWSLTVERQPVSSDQWAESQCRCQGTWPERHADRADPVKVLPEGLRHIDIDEFVQLRQQFIERLYGHSFSELPGRVEQELEIASNDPGHPLRVLEDMGSAEYGQFVQTAHLMAQAWGLRQNLLSQRGSFLSWMRVPGDVLMPCICPTGAVVAISIRFPRERFLDEMRDPSSDDSVAFADNIRDQVASALAAVEPTIVDLHVISLEAGSVIVNADVLLSTSMDKPLAQSKVETALKTVSERTSPPTLAEMEIDPSGFIYEVMECSEEAPSPPANGLVSVPDHRTTGTRAIYTCAAGYQFSDGETTRVELTCGHVSRVWGSVPLLCERPSTTTAASGPSTTVTTTTTTTEPPTTTEEPEMDYLTAVTLPATAGLLIFFFLLIWCVSTKGPICSLITDNKKKTSEIP